MAEQSTSQPSELQQALEQAAGPLDDYLEPDIHAADYGPEDSEAVEPKEFPPPPTGPELTGFVANLNGATDWPDPPPRPGKDAPWDVRPIRADQLQAGDVLHYADHAVTVVEVSHPVVPLVCRRDDLTMLFGLTPGASALVLASRPSGWDDRAKAEAEEPAELDVDGPDTESATWRRLVGDYRQALADRDQLPSQATAVQALAARNRVDCARLALFTYLDRTGKED